MAVRRGSRRNQALKPRWFHILLALSDRDLHGSDIMRVVLEQSEGELRLWPAMLYGSLEQMMDRGLIEELLDDAERPEGASARRRYFRITDNGRQRLGREADRMAAMARLARARNALRETDRGSST
jgi:DNA-binding PadR family transcriptional regulator